jgi:hypothetical protein
MLLPYLLVEIASTSLQPKLNAETQTHRLQRPLEDDELGRQFSF